MVIDPYATGVLNKERHARLVANLDRHARDAGIPVSWLWTSAAGRVSPQEEQWVIGFRHHKLNRRGGMLLHGRKPKLPIEDRMSALVAVLTRNFVHARLMTLNQVLESVRDGDPPMMSGLFIPNFFVPNTPAAQGQSQEWRVAIIYDLLLSRQQAGLQTVIYAASLAELEVAYGASLYAHLDTFYDVMEA